MRLQNPRAQRQKCTDVRVPVRAFWGAWPERPDVNTDLFQVVLLADCEERNAKRASRLARHADI